MRTKKTDEERLFMARRTGQWSKEAICVLLHISRRTLDHKVVRGEILFSPNLDSLGNAAGKSQRTHCKTEHLRDYLKRQYGPNAPILKELI